MGSRVGDSQVICGGVSEGSKPEVPHVHEESQDKLWHGCRYVDFVDSK